MNADQLRALASALSWHVGQTFTPGHQETFAQAAEIIDLLAWAEESVVKLDRSHSGQKILDTLRRAREASKS